MKIIKSSILTLSLVGLLLFVEQPEKLVIAPPQNFHASKKIAVEIFSKNKVTFYCRCQYDENGVVNWDTCGYKPKTSTQRAKVIEWEHIMPAYHFGKNMQCWKDPICQTKEGKLYKGRRCCQQINKQFVKMESDLHNLVPAIGEINAARSNYTFELLPNIKKQEFGACQIKIDPQNKRVEPAAKVRGTIARSYLYMSARYNIELSEKEIALFNKWAAEYPPEQWEIEWNQKVSKIQGNENPFISKF
jgi:deoxyribonuclease-1